MQNNDNVTAAVRAFITENVFGGKENAELKNDTSLISTRLMDSIVALKLVSHLEATFNIEFEAHEVNQENLETIDRITAIVQSKIR